MTELKEKQEKDKLPSFLEDHISQIPALQLLQNLGFVYLRPQEVHFERNGKPSNLFLEGVLEKQLRRLNRYTYKGTESQFSDKSIKGAIQALKDVPFDGLVRTSEKVYDLLSLGKSFEETIGNDTKSFTIRYIDWERIENNVFHITEEFEVERTASTKTCRPDIVLFVNGIPFVVIECKRPNVKGSLTQAIKQHRRNQKKGYIPKLFTFAQLLLATNKNEVAYGTTGTEEKFWSQWREDEDKELSRFVNKSLTREQKSKLFAERFAYVRNYFDELEINGREITEQDRAIYNLCRPERLMELAYKFIVFDAAEKKIARYQQYFAVKDTLERIKQIDTEDRRAGGVIWHTQGSGKSLTMVMIAKSIALERTIENPKIVLVTDRIDLDDQIYTTFLHCGKEPIKAKSGKYLFKLLSDNKEAIITTTIFKFKMAVNKFKYKDESKNIFVLVDEGHRTQYKETHNKMRQVLPKACYIAFTGTPLMKKDKNTVQKFGGFIDTYNIRQAVADKTVVPLLYEGRHILQEVDQKAIDKWFEIATKPLTKAQQTDLMRKFSSADHLNEADRKIHLTAYDISEHFSKSWKGTPFKGQLVAASKSAALKFKKYLDEFGMVTSEVLISAPDVREDDKEEGDTRVDEDKEAIQAFWRRMMDKYGDEEQYNKQLINAFKHGDEPEIIIVVHKLLTGFDAPRNVVMYIARSLKEHDLLQAIARVNRLYEDKDFGYIIDYYGVLKYLGEAMNIYAAFSEFDQADIEESLIDVSNEVQKLQQKHSELWDIFSGVTKKLDEESYEQALAEEDKRQKFYNKVAAYSRTLAIALSTFKFIDETAEELIKRYKRDLTFFQNLKVSVKKRYADEVDYRDYDPKIRKLINTHVHSDEVLQITEQVNIFEQVKFQKEIDKLQSPAAKADTIAHRTKKTITEKMEEDPIFYKRFSQMIEEAIEDFKEGRISDALYLNKVTSYKDSVRNRDSDDFPDSIKKRENAKAYYGVINETLKQFSLEPERAKDIAAQTALDINDIIEESKVIDWKTNTDVQNAMKNQIDDRLFDMKNNEGINLSFDDMDLIIESSINIAMARREQ